MNNFKSPLKREGNKTKIAPLIIKHFPKHKTYIEPFLGTGSIFFNKPLAKHNILNDHSKFIADYYNVLKEYGCEYLANIVADKIMYFDCLPLDCDSAVDRVVNYMIRNKAGFYGRESTIRLQINFFKKDLISKLKEINDHIDLYIKSVDSFANLSYQFFINSIQQELKNNSTFCYCDPPYQSSTFRLEENKKWQGLEPLIELLNTRNWLYAISEYNSPCVMDLIKKYKLNYVELVDSAFCKGKGIEKKEILIGNYEFSNIQGNLF